MVKELAIPQSVACRKKRRRDTLCEERKGLVEEPEKGRKRTRGGGQRAVCFFIA